MFSQVYHGGSAPTTQDLFREYVAVKHGASNRVSLEPYEALAFMLFRRLDNMARPAPHSLRDEPAGEDMVIPKTFLEILMQADMEDGR